jgi:hypothetical protein
MKKHILAAAVAATFSAGAIAETDSGTSVELGFLDEHVSGTITQGFGDGKSVSISHLYDGGDTNADTKETRLTAMKALPKFDSGITFAVGAEGFLITDDEFGSTHGVGLVTGIDLDLANNLVLENTYSFSPAYSTSGNGESANAFDTGVRYTPNDFASLKVGYRKSQLDMGPDVGEQRLHEGAYVKVGLVF